GKAGRRAGWEWRTKGRRQWHKDLGNLALVVDQAKSLHHIGDLAVNGRVEDAVAGADYRVMVLKGVPAKVDARGTVVLISIQGPILRIDFIARPDVQGEV